MVSAKIVEQKPSYERINLLSLKLMRISMLLFYHPCHPLSLINTSFYSAKIITEVCPYYRNNSRKNFVLSEEQFDCVQSLKSIIEEINLIPQNHF